MRMKLFVILLSSLALAWAVPEAQAGAIRYAGERIGKGSAVLIQATADAAQSAAGGVASAGKTTGRAIATGAGSVGKGAVAVPGLAVRGTKAAAKGIWKAVW